MNKMFLYPYKAGSKSAKALAQGLGIKRIKLKGSKFNPQGKVIINWGSSTIPEQYEANAIILNGGAGVKRAANKLLTFKTLHWVVSTPQWTEDREVASVWLKQGFKVFCRTKLTGNSGDGIVVAENQEQLVDAPLYTKWSRIANEYRIHVFRGEVLDRQRKARKRAVPDEEVNWKVRNLAGGFIFARGDCNPEQGVEEQAVKAVEALGLDFGAVDVIFTKGGEVKVLEVNTACGLEGTTLENYINKFKEVL